MSEILVVVAHPHLRQSRVNAALMAAAARLPPERVHVCDLYARYPDYFIDVAAEQTRLADARLVVWQHPVHWYGMPPLMKLWLDEVFAFGWAYGPGGTALLGKQVWAVMSTGGAAESYSAEGYNRHSFDAFLPPLRQTAELTGMQWLPPWVIHGAHRLDDRQIDSLARTYAERLMSAHPEAAAAPDVPAPAAPPELAVPDDARPRTT